MAKSERGKGRGGGKGKGRGGNNGNRGGRTGKPNSEKSKQTSTPTKKAQSQPKPPVTIKAIPAEERKNGCLMILDKKRIKQIRTDWAIDHLAEKTMRGPADDLGIVDENFSAYPIFAPVDLSVGDLPNVDTVCLIFPAK